MKVPTDFRYRCNNGARPSSTVAVQKGWNDLPNFLSDKREYSREPRMIRIADPMTKDCRYSADGYALKDAGCTGCKWMTN